MKVTKLMSWLKPFVVLSIICGFALTATAQNYYPAEVGNTWTLNTADGTEQRRYMIEDAEDFNGLDVHRLKIDIEALGTGVIVPDRYLITVDDTGLTLHRSDTDEGAFGIATIIYDPPTFFYPSLPTLGQTWQISGETELLIVGATSNTTTLEVVAFENVVTPAGTFENCAKIHIAYKTTTALLTLRPEEYIWLAPDVGPVRFQDQNDIVSDLVSYNLVEPAAEDMQPTEETTEEVTEEVAEEVTEETTEEVAEETTEEVTEVEAPAEPMVEEPMMPKEYGFDVTLEPGLNMISMPLMPEEPYTAKSLAAMLEATLVIRLDVATQQFSAYTSIDEGDGFGIDGGMGYIVNTPAGGMVKFTGTAWDNQPEAAADDAPAAPTRSSNKNTWAFVVTSDIREMETGTAYTLVAENLRTSTIATETITSEAKRSSAVWADLNRKSVVEAGDKLEIALYDERGNVVSGPFQRTVSTDDIRNAFLSLQLTVGDVRPKDTILAQNYPNPFNPETWIPYQLSKSAEVSIHIHNIAGHLIRTLDLGLMPIGSYMTPSTAAYWDGKNAVGERVSSGIYFYTLQTPDFAATRRMVILK
ncbi:MAG: hypothetical protein OXC79_11520 [Candidatus Poribacteria bacterium]|nr:hypothetical protein [Candidatus Poribacteria bacterium]